MDVLTYINLNPGKLQAKFDKVRAAIERDDFRSVDMKKLSPTPLSVLSVNYRNAQAITRVANTLLKIKHARFGSIDRESNHLVDATSGIKRDTPDCRRAKDKHDRSLEFYVNALYVALTRAVEQLFESQPPLAQPPRYPRQRRSGQAGGPRIQPRRLGARGTPAGIAGQDGDSAQLPKSSEHPPQQLLLM